MAIRRSRRCTSTTDCGHDEEDKQLHALIRPDVSLFTGTKPVAKDTPVIIRYSVEVGGLQVYNESYDVDDLAKEVKNDREKALALWSRRLLCPIEARDRR